MNQLNALSNRVEYCGFGLRITKSRGRIVFNSFDTDEGKPFRLFYSQALSDDLAVFRNGECIHEHQELCLYEDAGGNKHIKKQCQTCGEMKGKSFAKRDVEEPSIVAHQPDLHNHYQDVRKNERQAIDQKHIRIQKEVSGEFSLAYKEHINSVKWQQTRRRVIERANGLCEGCLERPATEVHHRNYDDLGNEFMFDLLALCVPCHSRLHPKKLTSDETEAEIARLECQCRWGDDANTLQPQCGKFGVSVAMAIAPNGECGPDRKEHESYR